MCHIMTHRLIGRHCGIKVYERIFRPKQSLPF